MNTVSGLISSIAFKEIGNHKKAILTLHGPDKQKIFIEFRDSLIAIINGFHPKDKVEIEISFEGKTSKSTGINHNNIIGKAIKKII